jgi:uncharacterized protein (DUF2235 family)
MHKNIIVCSDGTGNSSGKLFKTNVWRVYEAVDLADPPTPEQPRQFAFYDNGVGTSSFKPLAILGGALGLGLARNVRDLYAFLCRTWQPGDKIYGFGFSRGAFTIRVLVGLLMHQGLVPYNGNESELERNVASAYREYRKKYRTFGGLVVPLRALRDLFLFFRDRLMGRTLYREIDRIGTPDSAQPLRIEFVGLWDTVDAYGLPIDELTRAVDWLIWPLTMRDLNLNTRVQRARHALALDDERNTFHPRLWNEEPRDGDASVGVSGGNRNTRHIDEERISQVWFAGVHSDVGGGYADDGLSHVSLDWMMTEAGKYGVRFCQSVWDGFRALSDENGPMHDSRHGVGGYYRYNPRRIEKLANSKQVTVARSKIHESVFRRIRIGQDGYAPIVIPPDFAVMKFDGSIVDGGQYLGKKMHAASHFMRQREHVWNWVWWRRLAYFGTILATLALLLMPALPEGGCTSRLCFASGIIDLIATPLPDFASPWTEAFVSHPTVFLWLAGAVTCGLMLGGKLKARVTDAMRPLWYGIPATSPQGVVPPARPALLNRAVEKLRNLQSYQATLWFFTQRLMPGVFLLSLIYVGTALLSRSIFAVQESAGYVCEAHQGTRTVASREEALPFHTNSVCASTGLTVEKGATYRVSVTIPSADPWTDNGVPAGPNGVSPDDSSFLMTIGAVWRRHFGEPWMRPILRIGKTGSDSYPLEPLPAQVWELPARKPQDAWIDTCSNTQAPVPTPFFRDRTFTAEIVARSSGELFIYVNDAILFPGLTNKLYCNNEGSARLMVERMGEPSRVLSASAGRPPD